MRGLTITLSVCVLGQCLTAATITNLEAINLLSLEEQADLTLDALQNQGNLPNGSLILTGTFSNTGWTEAMTGSTTAGTWSRPAPTTATAGGSGHGSGSTGTRTEYIYQDS